MEEGQGDGVQVLLFGRRPQHRAHDGRDMYGRGCGRDVACGTYMEKLLSLQCLRDFGCWATLLSRGCPRAWAVEEKQEVLEELHTRTEKAEPPGEDDAGTRSESKSKIPASREWRRPIAGNLCRGRCSGQRAGSNGSSTCHVERESCKEETDQEVVDRRVSEHRRNGCERSKHTVRCVAMTS